MCCRKALAITGSESHSLRAPGRVARRNKRPLELHASGGLFFFEAINRGNGLILDPRNPMIGGVRMPSGSYPRRQSTSRKKPP